MLHHAASTPIAPPARESTTLSVSVWRIRRMRLAPRAARNENSLCREIERASSRFATLTHAISKSRLTAPHISNRAGRTGPRRAIHPDGAPHNVAIAAEIALPDAIAENRHLRLVHLFVRQKKVPPKQGANAQAREEISGCNGCQDLLGFIA